VTQAVLNVTSMDKGGQRYDSVPDEIRLYARGGYGEIAGKIDPNIYDKLTGGKDIITERAGALIEPAIARLRKSRGPFASDDDLLLAAFYDDTQYKALKQAGPIDTEYRLAGTPLLTLLKEVAKRDDIKSFHLSVKP
jgi:oxaloacetate decarboxylase alpha subunit